MPSTDPEKLRESRRRDYARPGRKEAIIAANKRRKAAMRGRLRTIKVEMGCLRCGFDECPEALEFHHRDGEVKLFNLGARLDASWSKIEAEIAKCDVLCANCHRMMSCSCDSHRRYT